MQCKKTLIYAIQALKEYQKGAMLTNEQIAQRLNIDRGYARKANRLLVLAGFLRTERGPEGGYILAKPLAKTSIAELVAGVDGGILEDEPGETSDMKRIRQNLRDTLQKSGWKQPVTSVL